MSELKVRCKDCTYFKVISETYQSDEILRAHPDNKLQQEWNPINGGYTRGPKYKWHPGDRNRDGNCSWFKKKWWIFW